MKKFYLILTFTILISGISFAQNIELSNKLIQKYKSGQLKASSKRVNAQNHLWLSPILREVFNNWTDLTKEAQDLFSKYSARPTFTGTEQILVSSNFALHYTTDGPEGESISTEDTDQNQIPDYAENMLATFINVSGKYHTTLALTTPPNDNSQTDGAYYDIYVSGNEAGEWTYGYVMPENNIGDNTNSDNLIEQYAYTSYMVMRNNYAGFGDETIAMEVTAAHEYMHAVQMGYDGYMDAWFMEASATWSEDYVFPGHDDNFQYLSNIFGTPDVALDIEDGDENGDYDGHWYGSWIFVRYMTEHTGNEIIKNIYERSINEWSVYAIDDELVANWESDFNTFYYNFAIANLLMTDINEAPFATYSYTRAGDYSAYLDEIKHENSTANFNFTGTPIDWDSQTDGNGRLMRLSSDYFKLTTNQNFNISLSLASQHPGIQLSLVKIKIILEPNIDLGLEIVKSDENGLISVNDFSEWTKFIPIVVRYDAMNENTESINYTLNITSTSTKIDNISEANISIFPNPVSNYLTIQHSELSDLTAKITDLSGKTILEQVVQNNEIIDVKNINNGIYFISLMKNNEVLQTEKIIINHK